MATREYIEDDELIEGDMYDETCMFCGSAITSRTFKDESGYCNEDCRVEDWVQQHP